MAIEAEGIARRTCWLVIDRKLARPCKLVHERRLAALVVLIVVLLEEGPALLRGRVGRYALRAEEEGRELHPAAESRGERGVVDGEEAQDCGVGSQRGADG